MKNKKAMIVLIFGTFLFSALSLVSANLCRGPDGYYIDCSIEPVSYSPSSSGYGMRLFEGPYNDYYYYKKYSQSSPFYSRYGYGYPSYYSSNRFNRGYRGRYGYPSYYSGYYNGLGGYGLGNILSSYLSSSYSYPSYYDYSGGYGYGDYYDYYDYGYDGYSLDYSYGW